MRWKRRRRNRNRNKRESERIGLLNYTWTKGSRQDQWIQVTKRQDLVQRKELAPSSYQLSRNGKVMSSLSLKLISVVAECFFVADEVVALSVLNGKLI